MKTTNASKVSNSSNIYIGLDLGDRKHAVCVLDSDAECIEEYKIPNNRHALCKLSAKYPKAAIAFE